MNLGRYEIDTYTVTFGTVSESRQRITYIGNNEEDIFTERYFGDIRPGYLGAMLTFRDVEWTDIKTHIAGETLVINDRSIPTPQPLIYLTLASFESVRRESNLTLTIVDSEMDSILLQFTDEFNYNQAYSLLNYILTNPDKDVNSFTADTAPPQIFFYQSFYGSDILLAGSAVPGYYSTTDGLTFSVDINWSSFSGPKPIEKSDLIADGTGLVYTIIDNRDEILSLVPDYVAIYENLELVSNLVDEISATGSYVVKINLRDAGQNLISPTINFTIV